MPEFISEPIFPAPGQADVAMMAAGEPGMFTRFTWRKTDYEVAEVVRRWKGYGPDGHVPGNEMYLKRHWVELLTTSGERMVIYFERQARQAPRMPARGSRGRQIPQARWWLYTLEEGTKSAG